MRFVLWICAAMLVSGPAFADGKGKDKDEHKEQKEKGKSDKKSEKQDKDDKDDKDEKEKGKSGEHGESDDDRGKSDEDHGKPGEHGEEDSPEGGEDEGAAPVDNLTAQKNELEKHHRRMAKIARLETLGSEQSAPKLTEKAKMLREKENRRHDKAMKRLKAEAEREEQE